MKTEIEDFYTDRNYNPETHSKDESDWTTEDTIQHLLNTCKTGAIEFIDECDNWQVPRADMKEALRNNFELDDAVEELFDETVEQKATIENLQDQLVASIHLIKERDKTIEVLQNDYEKRLKILWDTLLKPHQLNTKPDYMKDIIDSARPPTAEELDLAEKIQVDQEHWLKNIQK